MNIKEVKFKDEVRNKLLTGVETLADVVKVTMGSRGRNVLIQRDYGTPVVTKDGVSVAREVELEDPIENMGVQLVKDVASKTADLAGDGTTTATVLAYHILKNGHRHIVAGANPVLMKRGMDKTLDAIVSELKTMAKEVKSKEEIQQVATISANSDENIGRLIAEAMEKVGKDGVITVGESHGLVDEVSVVDGIEFDKGFMSAYFITDMEAGNVNYDNPYILVTDQRISALNDIIHILEECRTQGRPLLIIAEDVDNESLTTLIVNKTRGILNTVAVKAPAFGELKKEVLADIATLVGANVITQDLGRELNSIRMEDLGQAKKVIITKDKTTIVDSAGSKEAIDERAKVIKAELENANDARKEQLQERLARLVGGIASLNISAVSEVELKEKRDRVDDALSATKAAVEEGVVVGGGVALIRASQKVKLELSGDEKIGYDVIMEAVKAPLMQIAINAGYDAGVALHSVLSASNENIGFNASTCELVDMFEAGIIDPVKVERIALQNAVSVVGTLLTTEATISIKAKKE